MRVRQSNQQNQARIDPSGVRKLIRRILSVSGCPDAELSVLWVDDAIIRDLNRRWRGRNRATDVLSFPMREGRFAEIADHLLGDVVISLETVLRRAGARRTSADRIVAQLLLHGVLHLLGYDHIGNARRRARMRAEEGRILKIVSGDVKGLRVRPTGSSGNRGPLSRSSSRRMAAARAPRSVRNA